MKSVNSKKIRFDLGDIAQKNSEQLSKTPMIRVLYLSVLISVLTVFLVIFVQANLPPEVPLFYGFAEGQEQLSSPIGLVIPSICALMIVIINTILILKLKNGLVQKALITTSLVSAVFSFITTIKIILLVGSF